MDTRERKIKEEVLNNWEMMELGMKLKEQTLENKILKVYSIVNILSWFLVFNYIVTSIMFISLIAKGF